MSQELDPTDTQSAERTTAEARSEEQQADRLRADDLKWLMRHKQGRRIVQRLLDSTGIHRPSYVQFTGNTASDTAFMEGQRNIGLMLLTELTSTCQEQYQVMVKENFEHDNRNADRK